MDKTDKDILAESSDRAKQRLQLNLQNLVSVAVISATEALEAMRLVVTDQDAPFNDRFEASKFLANKIVPERVPNEGAGVPDLDVQKLVDMFVDQIHDKI
jgi:hypothetical protein